VHEQAEARTRERLVEAAAEVFVAHGFRDATVREICARAGANIAAVNYHFGDKEGLYRAVLEWAAQKAFAAFAERAAQFAQGRPERRLEAFVRSMAERMLIERSDMIIGKLMAREMVEPTSALDELIPRFLKPQHDVLRGIVTELLGPGTSAREVRLCCNSILGQMLFYKHARPVIQRLIPEQAFDAAGIEEIVAHVTAFSRGALASVRRARETGGAR